MLTSVFRAHGQFCASRPWEVIIGTLMLTVCVMSMSLFSGSQRICGWNTQCVKKEEDIKSSDTIILTITHCIAVVYLYLQFRKLHKLGSKYLLGIASVLTIVASFVFSVGIANILGSDLTGLNEALPFFLLLVDLSKVSTMARFALSSSSSDEVVVNIGRGMAVVGPQMTLDTLVETLVIGIGMLSGIKTLETMCCFGCLSVIANYLAFVIFYPACLALVLELTRGNRPLLHVQQLAKLWEEEDEKPNPVTQRVKVIMCAGLVFVYAQSPLAVTADDVVMATQVTGLPPDLAGVVVPDMPLWRFYLTQFASLSIDYVLTLTLTVVLALKYIVFDGTEVFQRQDSVSGMNTPSDSKDELTNQASDFNCPNGMVTKAQMQEAAEDASSRDKDETPTESQSFTCVCGRNMSPRSSRFILGDDDDTDDDVRETVSVGTQTEDAETTDDKTTKAVVPRSLESCKAILNSEEGANRLSDEEILMLVKSKHIPMYKLEGVLGNYERGVAIRRRTIDKHLQVSTALEKLPYTNYEYKYVDGACCENVIGYMPLPVGVAGPLTVNGKEYMIPMATTEGCLVASTNRGCRALSSGKGVKAIVVNDGMTRAPVVRFDTAARAAEVKAWLEDKDNFDLVTEAFNGTSRFARLKRIMVVQVARKLHVRFVAVTGDAMGMNMLSKGSEKALRMLQEKFFPDMRIIGLSGNFCTDKKPSAVNLIEGRGKSVVAEAVISKDIVKNFLKTSVSALIDLNICKNLEGSAAAGSIGGLNAQASNIVTAMYIATGQDAAQNVCSSNCITVMEPDGPDNEDLYISCTMPCLEVGTVGGGTVLPAQAACLDVLGVRGSNNEKPGLNASTLATIVCAAVMAGELSLMSALTSGDLVKSHMKYNRTQPGSIALCVDTKSTENNNVCTRTAP